MAWHPFRNIGLKVASTVLGALLWFTVSGHQIERRLQVSVSYSNVPAGLEMTGDQADVVSVHVRGDDSQVRDLGPGSLSVIVDLGDSHPGTNIIPLRTDEVLTPLGLEVMQVEPGTVTVTLEKSGELQVAVHPSVDGQPAPGFIIQNVEVEPKDVTVAGPQSLLTSAVSVVTERVSLEGRSSTLRQDVSVGVADAQLRVRQPRTVRVTVHIGKATSK